MERWFDRLYQRQGKRYLRSLLVAEKVGVAVYTAGFAELFAAFRHIDPVHLVGTTVIAVTSTTTFGLLAFVIVRNRSAPLPNWVAHGGGPSAAAAAWEAAVRLPRRWVTTTFLLMLPNGLVIVGYEAMRFDLSSESAAVVVAGYLACIALAALVELHLGALAMRPLASAASQASGGPTLIDPPTETVRGRLLVSMPLLALLSGMAVVSLAAIGGGSLNSLARGLAAALVVSATLGLALSLIVSESLVSQLRRLEKATRAVRSGRLDTRLPVLSSDELGSLTASFNSMLDGLQERQTLMARARRLEEEAAQLELDRRAEAQEAIASERARIARELHDVVAHGLSIVTLQAGAAREMLDHDPGRVAEPLETIERSGRDALNEMRRFVSVLRHFEDAPLSPEPGLVDLRTLVEDMRDAGLDVTVDVGGQPSAPGPGIELTVYRIVQEALTNARRHAGPTQVRVLLRYAEDALTIEVTDKGRRGEGATVQAAAGGGQGLIGMRERVDSLGGEFSAGSISGGGFSVRARLPLTVPA